MGRKRLLSAALVCCTLLAAGTRPAVAAGFLIAADDGARLYYASNSGGTWGALQFIDSLAGGSNSRGVAIADFDNDGDLDFVVGANTGSIYLFRNNGSNGFTNAGTVATLSSPASYSMDMAAGDFNHDGAMDFVASGNSATTNIYLGDGAGAFTRTNLVGLGSYARGLDVADFNRDGNLDLVRGTYSDGNVRWYPGNGDGTFGAGLTVGDAGTEPYGVAAGDFNNDGNPDVIANSGSGGDPYFFAGNGDGTFLAGVLVASLDFNSHGAYDAYDFDGDGDLDVVAVDHTGRRALFYPGVGDGTFGSQVALVNWTSTSVLGLSAPPLGPPAGTPIAVLTPASAVVAEGGAVDFDGSASTDPDGAITAWAWTFGDGGSDAAADPALHAYATEGIYAARLKVTDDDTPAKSAYAAARVTVQGDAPSVDESPVTFPEASADDGKWSLTLDGATYATDSEGIASYSWDLDDGLVEDFESGTAPGWAPLDGSWSVTNVDPLAGGFSYYQSDAASDRTWNLYQKTFDTDFTIEADVRFLSGTGEEALFVFRAQNEQDSYQVLLRGRTEQDVLLFKRVNGIDTTLYDFNLPSGFPGTPIDVGQTYHVKIACQGNRIRVYLGGILLFDYYDGTYSGGRIGLSTYRTEALFDNVSVTTTAATQNVTHSFGPGPHEVALVVADAAGQGASGVISMDMAAGSPPVANAGGPYSVNEAGASAGGWTFALSGSGSTDDVEIRKYVWDLGFDEFTGTSFQSQKWFTNGGVVQNDNVAVTGATWGTRYLVSRSTFPKVKGQIFEATVTAAGNGECMFGFKNPLSTSFHYNQFPYQFYIYNNQVYIYENGTSRGNTGFTISYGTAYDYRIELTDPGAVFSFRRHGTTEWHEVHRSTYSTPETSLRKGFVVASNTYTIDDFRETTAGATPSFTLYGTGTFPVSLTVTDRANQADTDSTTVEVTAGDPPVAAAGADQSFVENQATDGVWTVGFNASGSSDPVPTNGIYLYEWDFDYDGSTFTPSGVTGQAAAYSWSAPGTYTVAVRVTDHALQSHVDSMTVTIAVGAPPTAGAGGPYSVDEFTGTASEGGFTVTLDGTASSDAESSLHRYVWDLGTDTFDGTAFNQGKWIRSSTGVTQNETVSIAGSGAWGARYLCSKDNYSRANGLAFEAKFRQTSGGNAMLGFKNTSANYSYNQYPYAIYFNSGGLRIYESGGDKGSVGSYTNNTWYDVRIELKQTSGARYYYRPSGTTDWTLLYDSNNGNATTFKRGVDVSSGTFELDELKELAAGPTPSYRLYGLGTRTISLTVWDQANQTDTDSTTVTIAGNAAPVASAGPDQSQGESDAFFGTWTFGFSASGASDDHGIYKYEWDWDYDGTFDPSGDEGVSVTHAWTTPGVRIVAVRVTDHALQSTLDTATVSISGGLVPTADAGADLTTEGKWPVVFNAGASSDDLGIVKYEWAFGDGRTGTGKTPSHIYWSTGTYTATLTVFDNAYNTATDTVQVTVLAAGDAGSETPVADAGGPYTAGAGGPPAYFNGSSSSDDYGIVRYTWDVDASVDSDGDGNLTNDVDVVGRKPFYTYANAGTYTATLTVEDGVGKKATATATVNVATNLAPHVICVPWRATDPTIPHETYNGKSIRLKAIVRDAGDLTYQWHFNDGTAPSPAAPAAVGDKYAIEVSHTFPASADGTPYTATLKVWDSSGLLGEDSYYVVVRPDNLDTRTNIAIDEGLWFMHKNQNRTDGKWSSYSSYYASPTASSLQAFEINGHLQDGDNQENPYVETVNKGFAYLFTTLVSSSITSEPAGNPDTNGNHIGIAVNSGYPVYEGGMVMDAIASSNTPLAVAMTGGTNVRGRHYYDILTDMVDKYAWGQDDADGDRGGWRYGWDAGADNSACQWAAIGMMAAEDNFGINVPQFVKNENYEYWLKASYDGTGFGYTGPGNGVALTPSGMVQLAFDDRFTTDPLWRTAEDYIADNWFWQANNYYGMYALVKALRLARPYPVVNLTATGLDWYNHPTSGVRKWLTNAQNTDGGWPTSSYGRGFNTAWSVTMLTPTLFVQPPVADAGDDVIWAYGMPLAFNAEGSSHLDPSRHIVKYEWDFDGDGDWDFTTTDPADPGATFTYADPNPETQGDPSTVFTVRLRVTDDNEPPQTAIDTRQVTVAEPPHAPYARHGGPYRATAGIPFALNGGASYDIDPGDSVTRFEWDLDNDGVWFDNVEVDTGSATATHTYAAPGVYNIGLRVWDNGVFHPVDCVVGVNCVPEASVPVFTTVSVEANLPPVAAAGGPYTTNEGAPLNLSGTGSWDPNADPLTYSWDLDGDGVFGDATTATVNHAFGDDGDYVVRLRVSDSLLDHTATATVHVNNVAPAVSAGSAATIPEGSLFSRAGSFTDPGADTWTATVDYGDGGGAQALTLQPDKSFALSHTYTENGSYVVTVTVTDDDGGVGLATVPVTVTNAAPGVNLGEPVSLTEGTLFTRAGFFTDPGADSWTATVDYGEGPQPLALNPDKSFTLSRTYADNGGYTITVSVDDGDGGVGVAALSVTVGNVAPAVDAGPGAASATEGGLFSQSGSFTDPGSDTWTATVDYGDGGGAQALALNADKTFALSHTYADDGNYTVTVAVQDDDGGAGTDTVVVTVGNVAPGVNAGPDATLTEGGSFVRTGSVTDPGTESWLGTVDYGDGSGLQSLTVNPDRTFSLAHVYADNGTYVVGVTVQDGDGGAGTDTVEVTVFNAAPAVDAGPDASVAEAALFTRSGSFADPGADTWTATVDYGDGGGTQALTLDLDKSFVLSHAYADDGVYTVTVTVTDDDGAVGSDTVVVTVVNASPAVNPGQETTVAEGSLFTQDGSFSDPGSDTWTATVDYGDGGGPEALALNPDNTFVLHHTYADDGTYTVAVTVTDDDGGEATANAIVTVTNAAPTPNAGSDRTVDKGTTVNFTGSFVDPGTADTHTAVWSFGDGSPNTSGTLTPSHVYTTAGNYTVTLTVTDDDGGVGVDTLAVTVRETASTPCDIDLDGDVDRADINLISAQIRKTVPPADPRLDIDHNGVINSADARACVLKCTRPSCAVQ